MLQSPVPKCSEAEFKIISYLSSEELLKPSSETAGTGCSISCVGLDFNLHLRLQELLWIDWTNSDPIVKANNKLDKKAERTAHFLPKRVVHYSFRGHHPARYRHGNFVLLSAQNTFSPNASLNEKRSACSATAGANRIHWLIDWIKHHCFK